MSEARIVIAAPASGSGKTTVTCALLAALQLRGVRAVSFKCGPDYIDPLFHEQVIGVPSETLDLFFSKPADLRRIFRRHAAESEIAVIEGVMGYYDGLGAAEDTASTYRVAAALDAPAVLVLDARGQSLSAIAVLEGFLRFRPDSRIRGVIFNRMSERVFLSLRKEVERLGVVPLGYLPRSEEFVIGSRHLGLITPDGIKDLKEKLSILAKTIEHTVDLDRLLALADAAPSLPEDGTVCVSGKTVTDAPAGNTQPGDTHAASRKVRIAAAKDEAFCFWYKDNLRMLEELGAEIVFFSPIRDAALPEDIRGLILPGGYPELFARELAENVSMRNSVKEAVRSGLPVIAECGGFLYLHREIEDMDGAYYPMAGVLDAKAWRTDRLGRFGYVTLRAKADGGLLASGEEIRGHEFHYYESESCGSDLSAVKPDGRSRWDCGHMRGNLLALFPHLYFGSCPQAAERFVRRCQAYAEKPADPAGTGTKER
ncbi:MAG: cobyrinate a,c-diamide synthase [Lachnospiraceae bacterium]|nr:cobyrinate a,c-diamide synthase [Lachnospiraceae bacterium]